MVPTPKLYLPQSVVKPPANITSLPTFLVFRIRTTQYPLVVVTEDTKWVNVGRNPRSGPSCEKTRQGLATPQ